MWTKNEAALRRLSEVIRTDATTTTRGDFLITHAPFETLYINDRTSITENELLTDYLLAPEQMDAHKFIMIQGGNGSGKTHLIRWLKEKYEAATDRNEEAVILIQRAHNNLQDAMMQLLESDIFPEDVKERTKKQLQNARGSLSIEDFKKLINFKFCLEIENDTLTGMIDKRTKDRLPRYLSNPYILNTFLMKDGGPLDRMRAKIETTDDTVIVDGDAPVFTAEDFTITTSQINTGLRNKEDRADFATTWMAEEFCHGSHSKETREKVANYLNTKVSAVIRSSMDLKSIDFQHIFEELRKDLKRKGMRLTLFLEDINAFTGIDEALMEALLVDHSAEGNQDCCRLTSVVGSTIWFYENKLNSSIRERIAFNVYLREGSVISEHHLDSFTARYVNAINLSSGQVEQWYRNGAHEEDIPLSPSNYPFSNVTINGRDYSMFPFTENALSRLYSTLEIRDENNSSRTPRVVLNQIIQLILNRWYTLGPGFLASENNFSNKDFSIPRWADATYEISNRNLSEDYVTERSILLRIWGNGTTDVEGDTIGGVSKALFDAFEIPFPLVEGGQKPPEPEKPEPPPEQETAPNLRPAPDPVPITKYRNAEREIEEWYSNPKAYLRSHQDLRDDLVRFIQNNAPWTELEIPYKLVETCIQRRFITIEGQSSNYQSDDVILLRRNDEETKFLLLALARWKYLGGSSWEFDNGLDYYTIAISWLEKHMTEIQKFILCTRNSQTADDLAVLGVYGQYCMKLFSGGFDDQQSAEETAIALFQSAPSLPASNATHPKEWDTVAEALHSFTEIYPLALSFFRKSIGGRRAEDTNYMFVDAHKLLQIINRLKGTNWSLEELRLIPEKNSGLRTQPVEVIELVKSKKSSILQEGRDEAHMYRSYFSKQISEDLNYNAIKDTILEMQGFLIYLEKNNLSYDSSLKNSLNEAGLASKTQNAIQKTSEILSCKDEAHLLSLLSREPFSDLTDSYQLFIQFDKLLSKYDQIFISGINQQLQEEVDYNLRNAKGNLTVIENQYGQLKGV